MTEDAEVLVRIEKGIADQMVLVRSICAYIRAAAPIRDPKWSPYPKRKTDPDGFNATVTQPDGKPPLRGSALSLSEILPSPTRI